MSLEANTNALLSLREEMRLLRQALIDHREHSDNTQFPCTTPRLRRSSPHVAYNTPISIRVESEDSQSVSNNQNTTDNVINNTTNTTNTTNLFQDANTRLDAMNQEMEDDMDRLMERRRRLHETKEPPKITPLSKLSKYELEKLQKHVFEKAKKNIKLFGNVTEKDPEYTHAIFAEADRLLEIEKKNLEMFSRV
jgi:hypothetical protein